MNHTPPKQIAFYAPLKSPDHPVASGDRLMARQLMAALTGTGCEVSLVSSLRSYLRDPENTPDATSIRASAAEEIARLDAAWRANGPPALWFCYHPYFKSPDLIGPTLCRNFGLPYVTAESSYSKRRNIGHWAEFQARVLAGVSQAVLNICLTRRDQDGLVAAAPAAHMAHLAPFIDTAPFLVAAPRPEPGRLITVAMMRPGDKAQSYAFLAAALGQIQDLPWRLSIIGDGEKRAEIETHFARVTDRIDWLGALPTKPVADHLSRAELYVWPGFGEAYGLAYLEAQAAGLPVVAQNIAGVPEVVAQGATGLLTAPGDVAGYAAAIRQLLVKDEIRQEMAQQAHIHVTAHHDQVSAATRLSALLIPYLDKSP